MVRRGRDGAAVITDPYPDNDKDEWVVVPLTIVRRRSGLLTYSAEIYANRTSKDAGGRPFLINSWKSQIRPFDPAGEHQRIQVDDQERMLHASGEHVSFTDVENFLLLPSTIQWQNDVGQFLPSFMFPNYDGVLEALDPEWLRERFTLDAQGQVEENIDRYLQRVVGRRLDGDHRGTTLNLQIAASADDGHQDEGDAVNITDDNFTVDSTTEHFGFRFVATIPAGDTVTQTQLSLRISSSGNDEPQHQVKGEAGAAPVTFTTTSDDIDSRTRTTASHDWDDTDLGTSGEFWEWGGATPTTGTDISSIIQENVDAVGELTALVFIVEQHTNDSTRDLGCFFYDFITSLACKLDVEHSAAGIEVLRRRIEGA